VKIARYDTLQVAPATPPDVQLPSSTPDTGVLWDAVSHLGGQLSEVALRNKAAADDAAGSAAISSVKQRRLTDFGGTDSSDGFSDLTGDALFTRAQTAPKEFRDFVSQTRLSLQNDEQRQAFDKEVNPEVAQYEVGLQQLVHKERKRGEDAAFQQGTLTTLADAANAADQVQLAPAARPPDPAQTQLSPDQEKAFQDWFARYAKATGNNPDPNAPDAHYDYRGFFQQDQGKTAPAPGLHLPDTYKFPGHETFSVESKYYTPGMAAGRWEGDTYVPIAGKSDLQDAPIAARLFQLRSQVLRFAMLHQGQLPLPADQWADATYTELAAKLHKDVVAQLQTRGDPELVGAYLDKYKAAMAPADSAEAGQAIAGARKAAALAGTIDQVIAENFDSADITTPAVAAANPDLKLPTLAEMEQNAHDAIDKAITDPTDRQKAHEQVAQYAASQLRLQDATQKARFETYQTMLKQGVPLTTIEQQQQGYWLLDGDHRQGLQDFATRIAKPIEPQTDRAIYDQMTSYYADPRNGRAGAGPDLELLNAQGKFSEGDYKKLVELRDHHVAVLTKGDEASAKFLAGLRSGLDTENDIAQGLFQVGPYASEKDKQTAINGANDFKNALEDELHAELDPAKGRANSEQVRDVAKRLLQTATFTRPGWMRNVSKQVYQLQPGDIYVTDIPAPDRPTVQADLAAHGLEATDENLKYAYLRLLRLRGGR
jgi:hypothetical protein